MSSRNYTSNHYILISRLSQMESRLSRNTNVISIAVSLTQVGFAVALPNLQMLDIRSLDLGFVYTLNFWNISVGSYSLCPFWALLLLCSTKLLPCKQATILLALIIMLCFQLPLGHSHRSFWSATMLKFSQMQCSSSFPVRVAMSAT